MPSGEALFLFGVVPFTWSTVAVLLVGLVAVAILWKPLVVRTGWQPMPIMFAGVCLAATAALTLGGAGHVPNTGCVVWNNAGVIGVLTEASHDLESFFNAALLLPLGLTLVLAMRRTLPPLLVVLVLPGLIEAAQLVVPGRVCSTADYLLNVSGGLVGVAAGAVTVRWSQRADGVPRG
ncbi:VanZ family protein [Pseudonocardia sp. KRD-182]|uniref:VanZ family protein n=1 Tax=Pseudonocardia oceani TaxID=2792013 RepID=UPI001C49D7AC|nr:VanZ family protein [Pseudonocardia oceani]MBW0108844.1 VanZ family protein [Pseudonocardia oceani]